MPQESLRSIVYRSFVTCDDPKGVVECRTIRRSKTGSTDTMVRDKTDECRQKTKNRSTKGTSCQLLEVSRRAHKLNNVIDSCSKQLWYDTNSRDVAKDLLKGALDLQDSLHVLGKLQEASHYMAKWDRVRNEPNSSLVREWDYRTENQNPRLSVDGSSRDCVEEHRKVITYSLAKQNLLPNVEEMRCLSGRYQGIPSTSSSQSSTVRAEKGPSLIAKLMGLEEMPSRPLQTNSCKEVECNKILDRQKHMFETNKPKVRKSRFVFRKEDRDRRTMDIHEAMHFKGLLKSNFIKEIKYDSHQWSDFFSEQKLINDSPPIVLIKPRYSPHLQTEEKFVPRFHEGRSLNTDTMLRKVQPPSISSREGAKERKEKEAKPVKSDVKAKEKLSMKTKTSGPITVPLLKKEATHRKTKKITKPVNEEVARAKNLLRSKDEAKVTPPKSGKLENGSNVTNNKMSHQRGSQTVVRAPNDRKKGVNKMKTAKITNERLEHKGDGIVSEGKKIDPISESDTVFERYSIETDIMIEECRDNSEDSVCDITLVTTDYQNNRKCIGPNETDNESFTRGAKLKALLLSCPAFLNHADYLFYLHVNLPTTSPKFDINEFTDANRRLFLDCANEIVRRISFPDSQPVHPPLLSVVGNAKTRISLDHLLRETCDQVEALRNYSEVAGEDYPAGSLYSMLERDLKHKEALSGIWDLGWKKGFTVNDTIQVVDEIEKQLLNGLIEEIYASVSAETEITRV
ncbi:hypothetical protein E1A91_D07G005800v1 [Gossypium mustelinum]|uniref:DUF3741 domain-containing protein n=1 Tax=Gossypium mustelinum TaxID=34275 RepID=A0A5D2U293_GOSMU|nr:hypothetical protein E1A91_D07G005800v1 [Gossypium mustelinum]